MSGGLHRVWKRFAVAQLHLRPGERVLDFASGTGDLIRPMVARSAARALCCIPISTPRCWRWADHPARSRRRGADGTSATPRARRLPTKRRRRDHRLRPAQCHPSDRALREMRRVLKVVVARWCLSSRARTRCSRGRTTGTRSTCCQKLGANIAGDAAELPVSRREHPHAPAAGGTEDDVRDGGFPSRRILQPHRWHRCGSSRLPDGITCTFHPLADCQTNPHIPVCALMFFEEDACSNPCPQ